MQRCRFVDHIKSVQVLNDIQNLASKQIVSPENLELEIRVQIRAFQETHSFWDADVIQISPETSIRNSTSDDFENLGNSLWCKKEVTTRSNIFNDLFIACPADFMVGVLGLLFYNIL